MSQKKGKMEVFYLFVMDLDCGEIDIYISILQINTSSEQPTNGPETLPISSMQPIS